MSSFKPDAVGICSASWMDLDAVLQVHYGTHMELASWALVLSWHWHSVERKPGKRGIGAGLEYVPHKFNWGVHYRLIFVVRDCLNRAEKMTEEEIFFVAPSSD